MADHSNRYHRRCADLGIDGEYRIGKLVFVCRLTSNRQSAVCGALMLCDCGLFCKLTMPMLNGMRTGEPLPWECLTCQRINATHRKTCRSKATQRLAKVARRVSPAPRASLRGQYLSEYHAWKAARFGRQEPMCKRWEHRKAGFRNFLQDIGSKPTIKARLTRRDKGRKHSKENTYWRIPPTPPPKVASTVVKFVLKFKPHTLPPPPIKKNLSISDGNGLESSRSVVYPWLSDHPTPLQDDREGYYDHEHSDDSGHPGTVEEHPGWGHPQPDPQASSGDAGGAGV